MCIWIRTHITVFPKQRYLMSGWLKKCISIGLHVTRSKCTPGRVNVTNNSCEWLISVIRGWSRWITHPENYFLKLVCLARYDQIFYHIFLTINIFKIKETSDRYCACIVLRLQSPFARPYPTGRRTVREASARTQGKDRQATTAF